MSHKKTYLCALSVRHRFTYLTARFAAVSKRNVHWVALKHRLNTWTLARFYLLDIGTYCCVLLCCYRNVLLRFRIQIYGSVSKKLCSIVEICPTPNPTLNLLDSVNKCKTDIKTYFLVQPCHFNFLICRFDLLCWTAFKWDSKRSSSPPKYISVLLELLNKLTVYENP